MKGLKEIIAGIGTLISGVLGVAIGNLEETLYQVSTPNNASVYTHAVTYYLFIFFIIVGLIYIIMGFMKK